MRTPGKKTAYTDRFENLEFQRRFRAFYRIQCSDGDYHFPSSGEASTDARRYCALSNTEHGAGTDQNAREGMIYASKVETLSTSAMSESSPSLTMRIGCSRPADPSLPVTRAVRNRCTPTPSKPLLSQEQLAPSKSKSLLESADGRMVSGPTRPERQSCATKKQKNPLTLTGLLMEGNYTHDP